MVARGTTGERGWTGGLLDVVANVAVHAVGCAAAVAPQPRALTVTIPGVAVPISGVAVAISGVAVTIAIAGDPISVTDADAVTIATRGPILQRVRTGRGRIAVGAGRVVLERSGPACASGRRVPVAARASRKVTHRALDPTAGGSARLIVVPVVIAEGLGIAGEGTGTDTQAEGEAKRPRNEHIGTVPQPAPSVVNGGKFPEYAPCRRGTGTRVSVLHESSYMARGHAEIPTRSSC